MFALRWWRQSNAEEQTKAEVILGRQTVPTVRGYCGLAMKLACAMAVFIYASFALSLQSITVKVQNEAPGIGYVYTWYAMTSCAVALLIAVAGRRLAAMSAGTWRVLLIVVSVSFLFVQNTVNWRLSEQLAVSWGVNRRLLDAFDDDASVGERCATLVAWTSVKWPDYYRTGVINGLQESYLFYFDEPFCPFVSDDA
jgi:hypothetical protein